MNILILTMKVILWAIFAGLIWLGYFWYGISVLVVSGLVQLMRVYFGWLSKSEHQQLKRLQKYYTSKDFWLEIIYYSLVACALFYFLVVALAGQHVYWGWFYILLAVQFRYWMHKFILP
jgi:hypothetical protein